MSKLDKFLVSKGLLASFAFLLALCLDRNLSDHRPILMWELSIDYGPTPFRFFHSWFNLDGFDKIVEDTWKSLAIVDSNGMINLKKKFQALKIVIKQWTKNAKKSSYKAKISIETKLSNIDKILDQGEGDENTKLFHGILNSKRSQLAIRGTLVDGEWIVDPLAVKSYYLSNKLILNETSLIRRLRVQFRIVERINTFEFFHRYWKLLEHDIVAGVKELFASYTFPQDVILLSLL
ncbi:hypothetical protein Tco_1332264 [Tanacetum coccineum]